MTAQHGAGMMQLPGPKWAGSRGQVVKEETMAWFGGRASPGHGGGLPFPFVSLNGKSLTQSMRVQSRGGL